MRQSRDLIWGECMRFRNKQPRVTAQRFLYIRLSKEDESEDRPKA